METLRIKVPSGEFLVDASEWESVKTVEFATVGLLYSGRPCDVTWRVKSKRHTSYVVSSLAGTLELRLHRLLLNARRHELVDHINHDGLDNRMENIRICTAEQNSHNAKSRINASSKFVGVSWNHAVAKWEAYVRVKGKKTCLGYFASEEQAAAVRDEWVKANRPEFGYLNLPSITE